MTATLTTVNNIAKEIYQGKIRNQLNEESIGFKRIERTSEGVESQVGGKYVTFPIKVRRNSGIGYRNELEQLMAAGQQGYLSVRIGLKYGYGRVRLSGQVMDLVESNYQAFANAMDLEMNGIKNDIAKDINRIFYGDGTGTVATATAGLNNTVTVASTQYLEVGMKIDILDATGVTPRVSNREITGIAGLVVTFDGASATTTVVTTDIIVRTGNFGREPQGLKSLVAATGTLFNVDPTTDPVWKAYVNSNSGTPRALSEGLMILGTDEVRRQGGGKTSLILTSLGVRRAYFSLLSQQRRYTDVKTFDGGIQGLAFHNGREIPVVDDLDCPAGVMYLLDESSFKIYRDKDWSWLNQDGDIWKWVTDYDAFEAILKQYWEIGIHSRNANGVIKDITEA